MEHSSKQHPTKWNACVSHLRTMTEGVHMHMLRHAQSDTKWIVLILCIAALLRFPVLAHPKNPEFDEVVYANYAADMLDGVPVFDIHPPVSRMILSEIARFGEPFTMRHFPIPAYSTQTFGDFPYVPMRTGVAIFGTLIPLLLYGVARRLHYAPYIAGLLALWVAVDPAFVVYSRAILPDSMLVAISLGAIATTLLAITARRPWAKHLATLIAAILLGIALSMKWTALGVAGVIVLLYLFARRFGAIILTTAVIAVIYVGMFLLSLQYYPSGGTIGHPLTAYNPDWITTVEFPAQPTFTEGLSFMWQWHEIMLRANEDTLVNSAILQAPHPASWAVAKSVTIFWIDGLGRAIYLQGNPLLWTITFFAFLFECGWITVMLLRTGRWPIDTNETVLLLGYLGNYLPFFLIDRPMFLYHYFIAFLLLLLLLPRIAPRIITALARTSKDRSFAYAFVIAVVILTFISAILCYPTTYGFLW